VVANLPDDFTRWKRCIDDESVCRFFQDSELTGQEFRWHKVPGAMNHALAKHIHGALEIDQS
jgi:hypothetical protein